MLLQRGVHILAATPHVLLQLRFLRPNTSRERFDCIVSSSAYTTQRCIDSVVPCNTLYMLQPLDVFIARCIYQGCEWPQPVGAGVEAEGRTAGTAED